MFSVTEDFFPHYFQLFYAHMLGRSKICCSGHFQRGLDAGKLRLRSKLSEVTDWAERGEQEVTALAWRSDKHLMLHSHDEASFGVLSAVGCSHYSSHFISGHSLSL